MEITVYPHHISSCVTGGDELVDMVLLVVLVVLMVLVITVEKILH